MSIVHKSPNGVRPPEGTDPPDVEPDRSPVGATRPGATEDPSDSGAPTEEGVPDTGQSPAQAVGLIRYGGRSLVDGAVDLARVGLSRLRPLLPSRVRSMRNRRLAVVLLMVVAVVFALVVAALSVAASLLGGPTAVVVATATPSVIDNQPGGVGVLSASPQHVATVSLNVQGVTAPIQVTAVDTLTGEQVVKGASLLQLNPEPFEQNRLQVEATLQQSVASLAAAKTAAATGSVSGSGDAYLDVEIPTLQGQVALDQQLLQIADGNSTSIVAPISGYVSYVRVTPGQVVTPGANLIEVVDPTTVVVSSGMQLSDLQSIAAGDKATVTPSQLPGVHLHGTVVAVSATAANGGLEGTVVVSATNTPGHPVPIGTQAFVSIVAPVHAGVSVPTVAVLNAELTPSVAVVHDGRVHFQTVQLGATDATRTQIVSGLRAGQTVAINNLQMLTDGDKVAATQGGP
jgi:RND family efflux transporter MFP subunit